MAKKTVWKDNTTPPTNYLWLKVGHGGVVEGLFEWNGVKWVKIASGADTQNPIVFTALDGTTHVIEGITDVGEGLLQIITVDGYEPSKVITLDYVNNKLLKKDDPNLAALIEEALKGELYDVTIDPVTNTPVYNLKEEIMNEIIERVNVWITD